MQATFESPAEIVEKLSRFIVGQDQSKKAVAAAAYRHYLGLAYRDRHQNDPFPFGKPHLLLIGPTGSGKTHLVKTLARVLDVPFCYFSATGLVEAGYVGEHVDSLFLNLLEATRGELDKAHRGIVFVDEIDKIRRQGSSGRDVSGEGVQSALLPILDGTPLTIRTRVGSSNFDPSRLLIICAGAFVGLDEIVRKRLGQSGRIGFSGSESVEFRQDDLLTMVTCADLERFGMIPEFIGRFDTISTFQTLNENHIIELLRTCDDSCLRRQQRLFKTHGIDLELIDDAIRQLAGRAVESRTNARGIESELSRALSDVTIRLPELSAEGVCKVILTTNAVTRELEPDFERRTDSDFTQPTEAELLRRDVESLIRKGALCQRGTDRKKPKPPKRGAKEAQSDQLPF